MKSPFGTAEKPPINFSLRVIATDLPVTHKNFKIKLAIDFVPDFIPDGEYTNPNFNGSRVNEIMKFISDDVITKVMEFIYYDRANKSNTEEQGNDYEAVMKIYERRRKKLKIEGKMATAAKKNVIKDQGEEQIKDAVKRLMNNNKRKISLRESNLTNIRFEHFSPSKLLPSIQFSVNGEKRLPPPNA